MRVYVRVPQAYASQLRHGMKADLNLAQYPHQAFKARLETIAKESRTVLAELMADNLDGQLWPGTFAEVHFQLPPDTDVYRIPTSALVFREQGLQIAIVGADDKVVLKSVTAGRDLGTEIEILSGLDPSDQVIDNPPDSINTGDVVRVAGETANDGKSAQLVSGKRVSGTGE
jgi:multidrug efflux pump subunit AcrA (membrane-fusion protein)